SARASRCARTCSSSPTPAAIRRPTTRWCSACAATSVFEVREAHAQLRDAVEGGQLEFEPRAHEAQVMARGRRRMGLHGPLEDQAAIGGQTLDDEARARRRRRPLDAALEGEVAVGPQLA